MRYKVTYVVMTVNKNGEHFPYYEQALTAQDAVNEVLRYKDSNEKIESVYKEVAGWVA